ncbi:hypothetical protein SAMN04488109_1501 [Chryseolinea serpens]|uniref:Uncharacterized protein n=1 Tax=Chryseolinea serpens TaxID=947013 RepID=A0A1M5M0K7_9BACT|nr:hypothetical protein [Chryseolinea serpens]SHG70872.1 hypothetical protein SAMN04488109_1501 [Chryseolinea serpens]
MKKILFTLLTLLAIDGFGQTWIDYMMDDNLTISVPEDFVLMDTLGQRIVQARIDNALIMIQRIKNNGETVVYFAENLTKAYEEFQEGMIRSHKGVLKSQQWIEESRVLFNEFSYYAYLGEEKQLRHCRALFINDNWYAIQFWEVESMTDELAPVREKLFTSIKLPEGVSRENQTSNGGGGKTVVERKSTAYELGYYGAIIVMINLALGFVVGVVLVIVKITRRKKSITSTNLEKVRRVAEEEITLPQENDPSNLNS